MFHVTIIAGNMMKKKLVIALFFLPLSFAQNSLEQQYAIASKLFDQEQYYDAVTEFKRLILFDEEKLYSFSANLMIGLSYKAGGKYSEAVYHLTLAEINAKSEDDIFTTKLELIRSNILRRTFTQAHKLLDELELDGRFSGKSDAINYWRGWAFMLGDNWEEAANAFSELKDDHELKLLSEKTANEKYSVTTASLLSTLIPGAGQFYTGEFLSGLLSISWNVLFGFLAVKSFNEERIFDGLMITNLLWLRFYIGSRQNAVKFATEKNTEIANSSLRWLRDVYTGEKP